MRFTAHQYDQAIEALQFGKQQLEPDGENCPICSDSGHMAWECGHNPLKAMALCEMIAKDSEKLHETLHWLSGEDIRFGHQVGPRNVFLPPAEPEKGR